MQRELKALIELLLTSTPSELEIQSNKNTVIVKSRNRQVNIIMARDLSAQLTAILLYLYELTGAIFKHYLASARRLQELRDYINVKINICVVDCDEDTRIFASFLGLLVEDLNYSLERAINIATLLVATSKEVSTIRELRSQNLSETNYLKYQESLSRIASYLKRLELEVQSTSEASRLLDLTSRVVSGEVSKIEILRDIFTKEGFTDVYFASKVLGACPQSARDTITELYERMWSQSNVFLLAPGILGALLKRIIPRESLVELP